MTKEALEMKVANPKIYAKLNCAFIKYLPKKPS